MKKILHIILVMLAAPLWAAPSLTDLDSWQLPEDPEPAKPAVVEKKPAPVEDTRPELVIDMDGGTTRTRATRDVNEITVLNKTVSQLSKQLAGKNRFYVMFNANMTATSDISVKAEDGTRYAVVQYGKEPNYRACLFKEGVEQPLVSVAGSTTDKLGWYRIYGVNVGLQESDFTKAYPNTSATEIIGKEDNKVYKVYPFEKNFSVIFNDGKPIRHFYSEEELNAFTDQLQGILPPEEEKPAIVISRRTISKPVEETVKPKQSFKALVKEGTIAERRKKAREKLERTWEEANKNRPKDFNNYRRGSSSRGRKY